VSSGPQGFVIANDQLVSTIVSAASERLVLVAPALSETVAAALCERLQHLRPDGVTLVLDSDPEVYRLGYGSAAALERLHGAATAAGVIIARQPGVRVGLVIADHRTLLYAPTPAAVDAGLNTAGGGNGVVLDTAPKALERATGLDGGEPQVGRTIMGTETVKDIKADLEENPPQRFDVTRRVRVFNAFIEFVDLSVTGTDLARRTIPIPNHLLAVSDPQTERQLRATFRLVAPEEVEMLSPEEVEGQRRFIERTYFHVVPRYGTLILQREKDKLLEDLERLSAAVARFAERVRETVQQALEKNRQELVRALLPALKLRPPQKWQRPAGPPIDEETIERFVDQDLTASFSKAERLIGDMRVDWRFKGVTYEMLQDPQFVEAAVEAIPKLKERLHAEFDAAPAAVPMCPALAG
jgi:hypothetical protein